MILIRFPGPVLVSTKLITDPNKLHVRGLKNDKVVQDCGIEYVHFLPHSFSLSVENTITC